MSEDAMERATFGAGCFWCTEAVMERQEGVDAVVSGYMGGQNEDPTYEQVCSGNTGHAEVIQVTYDSTATCFSDLLNVFFLMHDPTTMNQQGADVGTQYRSVIFYHNEEQKTLAEAAIKRLNESAEYITRPIVTEVCPASKFYPAEGYHQHYYTENKMAGYCRVVISPKLKKLGLES